MSSSDQSAVGAMGGNREFPDTLWTKVIKARDGSSTLALDALDTLCRAYWYPLYSFVRRQGYDSHTASDLTQGFFCRLIEKDGLGSVDQAKGRFRSFLLASLKHFLANKRDWDNAQKRRPGQPVVSLDEQDAEGRFIHEPVDRLTPDQLFDRQWAQTIIDSTVEALRVKYEAKGEQDRFELLKPCLMGEPEAASYAQIGARLGLTEGAIKFAVSALRKEFGRLLRTEIADTLSEGADVEEELRHLLAAVSG